jgi:hypothetical protein
MRGFLAVTAALQPVRTAETIFRGPSASSLDAAADLREDESVSSPAISRAAKIAPHPPLRGTFSPLRGGEGINKEQSG